MTNVKWLEDRLRDAVNVCYGGCTHEEIDTALADNGWRPISERGPVDGQPYRQFVRIIGSRTHHGYTWGRIYCGEAFTRPSGAPDEMLQYRRDDIRRLCEHGDIDLWTAEVTHWMPATFPAIGGPTLNPPQDAP